VRTILLQVLRYMPGSFSPEFAASQFMCPEASMTTVSGVTPKPSAMIRVSAAN
jgi:hypothetical protein